MEENSTANLTISLADEPPEGKIAKTTVCMFVLVVSLMENVFILTVLRKNVTGRMRTSNSLFIANMTVADVLFAVQNLPQTYNNIMLNSNYLIKGKLGIILCKLDMFFSAALIIATNLTIMAIAIDRYFAVHFPLKKIITRRVCYTLLALTWLVSSIISSPLLYYCNLINLGQATVCHSIDAQAFKTWFTVLAGILAATLALMLVLYTAIGIKLKKKQAPGIIAQRAHQRREKRNREIYKMLITLIVVYYVCALPYFITILSALHGFLKNLGNMHFRFISSLLLFINGAINPAVYVIYSENFRTGAKDLLNRCICCERYKFFINSQERFGTRITAKTVKNGSLEGYWTYSTRL